MLNKIKQYCYLLWQNKENILPWVWETLICGSLRDRAKRLLICFDQFLNVLLLNGREDETLSSRFYRWSLKDGIWWKLPAKIVDTLFFFDCRKDGIRTIKHCEKSYLNEINRTGLPAEMRSGH